MKRATLIGAAALAGVALAGGVLVARDEPSAPKRSAATQPTTSTTPQRAVRLDRDAKPMRADGPRGIAATARIVAQQPDPAGGPDWVLRRYDRPAQRRGAAPVRCAQLGRLVDGEVAWVTPGASSAIRLPLADAGTSSCAITAPISQRLGVSVGGMTDGPPGESTTRIRTAVAWGVVDRPVRSAMIEHSQFAGPVELKDDAFLVVEPAKRNAAPPYVRLTVTDTDGGTRAAIPLASFSELSLPTKPKAGNPDQPPPSAQDDGPAPEFGLRVSGERFEAVAKLPADRLGTVSAIYATREPGRTPCVTSPVPTIGGRPAASWHRRGIGLVHEPLLTCMYVRPEASKAPMIAGFGGGYGIDRSNDARATADEQARRERRRTTATATLSVATPPGTRYLEVTSPVGVTTVRVTWARVTAVAYDGQKEVIRQSLGPIEERLKGRTRRYQSLFTFRALDAQGKQLGKLGRSPF